MGNIFGAFVIEGLYSVILLCGGGGVVFTYYFKNTFSLRIFTNMSVLFMLLSYPCTVLGRLHSCHVIKQGCLLFLSISN